MRHNLIVVTLLILGVYGSSSCMQQEKHKVKELAIVNPYFSDPNTIAKLTQVMDGIELSKKDYPDYSGRRGHVWSDVSVETATSTILEEFDTKKVTEVQGKVEQRYPESIMNHPTLKDITEQEILPKMFKTVQQWKPLPKRLFAQIFFQRCSTSDPMAWHQDPGEDYTHQAHYSLVLMLGKQDDPKHGWDDGKFFIRSGNPTDIYDEEEVQTIIPKFNQGLIFNNQINTHSTSPVKTREGLETKRDIIVIPLFFEKLPLAKEEQK